MSNRDFEAKLVDVSMIQHHETEKAILASDDGVESHAKWLPKSQIEIDRGKGDMIEVTMPEWLAKKNGLV